MASTVIIGSGIIGLSTAYYLAEHQPGSSIHLVDASPELFASASGLAGGFLAKDWFHPTVASLGELSFEEHRRLAGRQGGREKWGYAKSVSLNYEPRGKQTEGTSRVGLVDERRDEKDGGVPKWLRRVEGDAVETVDGGDGTAIV